MRLFIGIGLPPELAQALAHAARALISGHQNLRWTPPENLHLTLSFLGQVTPDRVSNIEQSLAAIHSPSLHLALDGISTFPNAGILYANIKPTAPLLALAEQVFRTMEACGFPREQRPYAPHITLARIKDLLTTPTREQNNPIFHQRFEAHELRLYESLTLPQGAQYKILFSFPLG